MPKIVQWVDVECAACGAVFRKRETDVARRISGRLFCSTACRNRVGSKPRKRSHRTCQACAKSFYPTEGTTKFCSRSCSFDGQRVNFVDKPCARCGTLHSGVDGRKYCSRSCWMVDQYKRPLDRTHNGKPAVLDNHGYVRIYDPGHPAATRSGWVFEHRNVVEQDLGRALERDEHVHHVNHIRHDNRRANLALMSASEHQQITAGENGAALKSAIEMRQRLAEYERRFGPLVEE